MGLYSEKLFPWLLDRALSHPRIEARRAALVGQAVGEVLEIGFGSGATLPFYDPAKVHRLTVIEPSEGMNRRAAARLAKAVLPVRAVTGAGERLPFGDAEFDTVVVCLTLCSVRDPAAVLREVRRVLKPGGCFLFLEHVLSGEPKRALWQRRLTPIQKLVGVGCHLDRDTAALVRAAGFEGVVSAAEEERAFGALAPLAPLVTGSVRQGFSGGGAGAASASGTGSGSAASASSYSSSSSAVGGGLP